MLRSEMIAQNLPFGLRNIFVWFGLGCSQSFLPTDRDEMHLHVVPPVSQIVHHGLFDGVHKDDIIPRIVKLALIISN